MITRCPDENQRHLGTFVWPRMLQDRGLEVLDILYNHEYQRKPGVGIKSLLASGALLRTSIGTSPVVYRQPCDSVR